MSLFRSQGAKVAFLLTGLFSFFGVGLGLASIAVYKPWGVPDSRREEYDEIMAEIERKKELKKLAAVMSLGKVGIQETQYDFGLLDPHTTHAEHAFRVDNLGEGDLLLNVADSSCICIDAELETSAVAPGEHTMITVNWDAGSDVVDEFEHSAIIRTNDPQKPEFNLFVRGKVSTEWGFSGPIGGSPDVSIGEPSNGSTLLFSQTYEDIVVLDTESSHPGITVSTEPVDEAQLSAHQAKSGTKLVATYVPTSSVTRFDETIKVHLLDPNTSNETWLDVPFHGKYRRPVRFYGPEIWKKSGLLLETVELGSDKKWAFFARFHVDHDVNEAVIADVKPDGLVADIEPIKRLENTFRVEIRLADDATPVQFDFGQQGYVKVADKSDPEISGWLPLHGRIIEKTGN